MSRSKFYRALLALGALLGAAPLMGQAKPAAAPAAAPAFPFGKYALVAIDTANGPPPGMMVEFTPTSLQLIRGGQVAESHGFSVTGDVAETFTFGGDCTDPGQYHWRIEGKVLTLLVISDPCTNRATSIAGVQFVAP
jgi:hypothetical protein